MPSLVVCYVFRALEIWYWWNLFGPTTRRANVNRLLSRGASLLTSFYNKLCEINYRFFLLSKRITLKVPLFSLSAVYKTSVSGCAISGGSWAACILHDWKLKTLLTRVAVLSSRIAELQSYVSLSRLRRNLLIEVSTST